MGMAGSWCRRWYEFCTVWANIWPEASSFLERSGRPTPALPRSRDQEQSALLLFCPTDRGRDLPIDLGSANANLPRYPLLVASLTGSSSLPSLRGVTPLWRSRSLTAAASEAALGLFRALARGSIYCRYPPGCPPSLPVSPNELGRGFVPTSFVKIGRRHSPSPTTAALDGKYHAWRIFSTEGFS